jgi:hypothetical protein
LQYPANITPPPPTSIGVDNRLEELGVVEITGADAEAESKLEEIIAELAKMEKGYDGIELEWTHGGPGIVGVKWKDKESAQSMPDHDFISKEDTANVEALVFVQTPDCWCDKERVDTCTITRLKRKRRKEARWHTHPRWDDDAYGFLLMA